MKTRNNNPNLNQQGLESLSLVGLPGATKTVKALFINSKFKFSFLTLFFLLLNFCDGFSEISKSNRSVECDMRHCAAISQNMTGELVDNSCVQLGKGSETYLIKTETDAICSSKCNVHSDDKRLIGISDADFILDTLILQNAKNHKTIEFKIGDQIKIENSSGILKGEITSITDNYISVKPKLKKIPVIDPIDVNQLFGISKYGGELQRAAGTGGIVLGSIGIPISLFMIGIGTDVVEYTYIGIGTLVESVH